MPYSRVLIPDEESGTFTAMILEFQGCFSQGSTPAEAYERLEDAARGWIEAALELGQSIPEPREDNPFSGKYPLRMPKSLHQNAARAAEHDGVSLNQFIVTALAERVGAKTVCFDLIAGLQQRIVASAFSSMESVVKILFRESVKDTAETPPAVAGDTGISYYKRQEVN